MKPAAENGGAANQASQNNYKHSIINRYFAVQKDSTQSSQRKLELHRVPQMRE